MSNSNLINPYYRLNVYDYVDSFCGWEPMEELIKYGGSPRNELYLINLIKTGGRAGEVLGLDKENFSVIKNKYILVKDMELEKRWHKIKMPDGTSKREHMEAIRKPFPMLLKEPLSQDLLDHLESVKEGPLFLSPYKHHKELTVSWGYKLIRSINDELPRPLFNRLGLNRPFFKKQLNPATNTLEMIQIKDVIHLWQHYFRAQRASQLKAEYEFSEADLMEYFGWLDYKTALHYSKLGAGNLAKKMLKAF
jgi:hypothetical protein